MAKKAKQVVADEAGGGGGGGGGGGVDPIPALDPRIKAAVFKNRGGWEQATDDEIERLWRSLPEDLQKQYLSSIDPAPGAATPAAADQTGGGEKGGGA